MDPAVLDPHRTAAPQGWTHSGRDRCPAGLCIIRPRMDTKTKLIIGALLVLVLAFLVVGGIIAIASPPDGCC
jgi:hypothetical protein